MSSDSGHTSGGVALLPLEPGAALGTASDDSTLVDVGPKKGEMHTASPKLPFTALESLSLLEAELARNSRGDSMEVHVSPRGEDGESLDGRGSVSGSTLAEGAQNSLRGPSKLLMRRVSGERELEPSFIRRRYVQGEERSLKAVAERSASGSETNSKPRSRSLGSERGGRKQGTVSPPSKLPGPTPPKDNSTLLNVNGYHRSIRNKSGAIETEYTLYLASQSSEQNLPPLGEKLFSGKLSDRKGPGEIKKRVGCRLRTELRPREGGTLGEKMRVREVAKSLEEMVLDIFFPDAVLRLEVFWDV